MPRGRRGQDESPVSFFSFQDVMMCTIGITIITTLVLILQLGRSAARAAQSPAAGEEASEALARASVVKDALVRRVREAELGVDTGAERRLAADATSLHLTGDELDRLREEVLRSRERLRETVRRLHADEGAMVALELMEQRDRLQEQIRELNDRRRIVYLVAKSDALLPLVTEMSGGRAVASTDQSREAPIALPSSDPDSTARAVLAYYRSLPDRDRRYLLVVLKPSGIPAYLRLRALMAADPDLKDTRLGLDLIPEDAWTTDEFPAEPRGEGAGP